MYIFETENCFARKFEESDFEFLYKIHADPEIMFFIGKGARGEREVRQHLKNIINHQKTYGFSAFACFEKKTGEFVGRVGLVHIGTIIALSDEDFLADKSDVPVEVGYVIDKKHWGKNYATELAGASLEWGFANTNLAEIVGKTNVLNLASQRVMQKIGMKFKKKTFIEEKEGMLFSILRSEICKEK